MDLFEKSLVAIVVVAAAVMFIAFFPDLRRYLKIRSM
ncbi:MAG: hypothetical protein JWO56_1549 [Acidobacteria bacterium]|nr:hypothetical protein [Acidobacteriota bacterium]